MSSSGLLEILYLAQSDPIAQGWSAFRPVLECVLALEHGLAPDRMLVDDRRKPCDLRAVASYLEKGGDDLWLVSSSDPRIFYRWESLSAISSIGMRLTANIPIELVRAPERAEHWVAYLRDLAASCPPAYGWAHNCEDRELGNDPHDIDEEAEKRIYEAYWLTILGAAMVEEIGRARVEASPAYRVITLDDGTVFLLTSATPADALTEEARRTQARVLVHLRDDLSYEEVLARLRSRSEALLPVERRWDPDLAELLAFTLAWVDLANRRSRELALNEYRPPEVEEWRMASAMLPPDVEDEEITRYRQLADEFVIGMHSKISGFQEGAEDEFIMIDRHFWAHDYARLRQKSSVVDDVLLPGLGAYLGQAMTTKLGGRWVPRRDLDEVQVLVGDRAYLPFLRVKHYLQSKQAVIDYSLTKFMREAARHLEQQQTKQGAQE